MALINAMAAARFDWENVFMTQVKDTICATGA
jgi:hypothetical protein